MNTPIDVVVIGGGPGGSVCATQLVKKHRLSVIVLEKAPFPRFHLGESLLPGSLHVLEEIGVLPLIKDTFIWKYGARFHDDVNKKKDRFSFDGAWKPDYPHAFEVPRDTFDKMLLDHARGSGAVVREGWSVERITTDASGRANGIEALTPDGVREKIEARFVVDATGRDALSAHVAGITSKIEGLDQTALFAHYQNVPRQAGKLEGDIDIVLFGDSSHPNWFWFIPFKDGRTSVGAVVSKRWIHDQRQALGGEASNATKVNPTALFNAAVAESETAAALLKDAQCQWEAKEATADFSYRVRRMHDKGLIRVGDAGGFIDPLFSTGAHLAMTGGKLGADTIAAALSSPGDEAGLLEAWETRVRAAAETFVLAVQSFYAGPLVDLLFAEDKHAVLRRSITSLLAGDVYGDSIWLRDTRTRLKEMLEEAKRAGARDPSSPATTSG